MGRAAPGQWGGDLVPLSGEHSGGGGGGMWGAVHGEFNVSVRLWASSPDARVLVPAHVPGATEMITAVPDSVGVGCAPWCDGSGGADLPDLVVPSGPGEAAAAAPTAYRQWRGVSLSGAASVVTAALRSG